MEFKTKTIHDIPLPVDNTFLRNRHLLAFGGNSEKAPGLSSAFQNFPSTLPFLRKMARDEQDELS
jgi:hypothetical protein